ncbi:MAG: mannose-1-phosphate guanylyltransferase/mannose-6-phosphate isomerase [Chlamydia sp. 32-24]|nr:MAG: mannose-1-phosphate guanylyltransferase/mannose-6-phosphate isomerase [Chlamydia sp. 32-24]
MIIPVILAGGGGERLWPLSRLTYPKQFIPILSDKSLLQESILRIKKIPEVTNPIIICPQSHRYTLLDQLEKIEVNPLKILLEPEGRNTASAIALAALYSLKVYKNPTLLILPIDHFISNPEEFTQLVSKAVTLANKGKIVTFGIKPTYPETGYGYIKTGKKGNTSYFPVEKFIEKPSIEHASKYIKQKNYFWNSGIYLFTSKEYIKELKKYALSIFTACNNTLNDSEEKDNIITLNKDLFHNSPNISIDYAILEKTKDIYLFPLKSAWSDIGNWHNIWKLSKKDQTNNVIQGKVVSLQTSNSFIHSESRLIVTLGIDNLVIVETNDALLVMHKDHAQDLKKIVNLLKQEKHTEATEHRLVYRPWGSYELIEKSKRYQVKHITVKPGATLSLQLHYHRSEHWVVVSGTAKVTCGNEIFLITENQSTYIPVGVQHRLENPGKTPLHLIEVQIGSYLNEDDIVRLADVYNRLAS